MSETPVTVTYDIKELFTNLERRIDERLDRFENSVNSRFEKLETKFDKLEDKFDRLEGKVNNLEVGQAEIKVKVEAIDERLEKVESAQSKQYWTLIGILGSAVVTGGVAIPRIVFSSNI